MADKQKRKRNKKTPAGLRKRIVKVGDTKRVRWYGRVKKSNGMWTEIRLKGCTTEEEAKGQLTEIRELTIDGLMVMDQEQAGCSESYRYEKPFSKEHKRIIKLHLRPYFENQSLADASLFRLKNHLESQSKPIAAATIKKILLVARRLMRAGCLNPEMPSIKINNERKYEMRYDHLEKMLAVTKNKDLQDMVLFIAYTGCRRGELAKVKWNDVDFKGLTVTFKETKNGKDHCIPMSNDLVMLLKRRKKGLHTIGYVFPGKDGRMRNLSGITENFTRLKNKAGLPENAQPVHSLRKLFATRLSSNGTPIVVIKDLLNHADVKTTQRYIGKDEGEMRKAVNDHARKMNGV